MNQQIVLIRGLFRNQYHWGEFPDLLRNALEETEIFCVDIPGAGERHLEASPTSIEAMVDAIRFKYRFTSKLSIISLSMGGMIGLNWAYRYPQEINKLVCINTSSANSSYFYERLLPKNYFKILIALSVNVKARETIIYSMVSSKHISNKQKSHDVINNWVAINNKYPMKKRNFFYQLLAALSFHIEKPSCELLFISSKSDKLVSYKATKALAKKWQSSLIINENDGHDIALDNPNWLCQQLINWLK